LDIDDITVGVCV
jgi:outer membrane protein assembly factor BamB